MLVLSALAALRALVTEGIQCGHMPLHDRATAPVNGKVNSAHHR